MLEIRSTIAPCSGFVGVWLPGLHYRRERLETWARGPLLSSERWYIPPPVGAFGKRWRMRSCVHRTRSHSSVGFAGSSCLGRGACSVMFSRQSTARKQLMSVLVSWSVLAWPSPEEASSCRCRNGGGGRRRLHLPPSPTELQTSSIPYGSTRARDHDDAAGAQRCRRIAPADFGTL